jgi:chemotaxis protein histidine kinase CheA
MDVRFENNPALLADFTLLARHHLATVATRLGWLDQTPSNAAALYGIWRSFYSIKCLASFLGLSALATIAYQIETLLLPARAGDLTISPEQAQAISQASISLEYQLRALTTELV